MKKLTSTIFLFSVSLALAGINIPGGSSGGTLPPTAGQAGKFLNTDGAITQWLAVPGGGDMLGANNLSDLTNAATARINLSLVPGTNVQAHDADLLLYGAITPSANIQTFLGAANYAAMRTQLGLIVGTNVQAYDADLDLYGAITPAANTQTFLGAANYAAMRTQLGLVPGTDVQAQDSDLSLYGAITPSANVQTFLGAADYSAMRTQLSLVPGTNVLAPNGDGSALTGLTGPQVAFADTDSNWTASNVQAALEELDDVINVGVPNAATGKVDWSQLTNVPAGFVDGADDSGAGGGDSDAIHDNVSGEIAVITDKAAPIGADHLLIEDSAATNSKKHITISSLEAAMEDVMDLQEIQGAVTDGQVPAAITRDWEAAAAYQPLSANLTTYAGIAPSANVQSLLGAADYAAMRTQLQLNTPAGWATTDKLVTIGAPAVGVSDMRLDAVTGNLIVWNPASSSADVSQYVYSKGVGTAAISSADFNNALYVGGSPAGIYVKHLGVDYTTTAAGWALLDDANAAAQRTTLGVAIDASGFNGNLATTDDTAQEVAQKLDDLSSGAGDATLAGTQTFTGANTFDEPITLGKNIIAPDAPMASTDINTSEARNTISSSIPVTLTFDTEPAAGAEFDVKMTNTDTSAQIWTIPSTYSEVLGVPRTLLLLQPGVAYSIRFRHEGSGVYRMWGDPIDYSDYPADVPATTDTTIFYQTASGLYRRTTIDDLLSVYDTMTAALTNKTLTDSTNVFADSVQIMCSDMTTAITAAGNKAYWRPPYAVTITDVRASAFTAPTGAAIIIDIEEEGTSILDANRLQIDATESFSDLGEPVISGAAVADNALVTIDFDQVGSTVAGAGILVTIFYTYSPH